jgi:hypothetical protein
MRLQCLAVCPQPEWQHSGLAGVKSQDSPQRNISIRLMTAVGLGCVETILEAALTQD